MINLHEVTYRYSRRKEILKGITADIGQGMHLLLGPNGSGKTTLLHILGGLLYPTTGICRLDGTDLSLRHPSETCRVQYYNGNMLFPTSDIHEMTRVHAPFFPKFNPETLNSILEACRVGIKDKFKNMSYGTRVKACLAYMLSLNCDILLLDEPTLGLDMNSKQLFKKIIVDSLNESNITIVSTNSPEEFDAVYDNLIVIKDGRLLTSLNIDEISDKIAFVTASVPEPDSIYYEPHMGKYRCMIPCHHRGFETQPDIALLYNSLMTDDNHTILEMLNNLKQVSY